jgi:hypothetical protein
VFPGHDPEHKVSVGYVLFVDLASGLFGESSCAIPASFGYGPLVDLGHCGQYDIVLMISRRIKETTVGILA